MQPDTYYLAFDLGATSIRGLLARLGPTEISVEEVLRFRHKAQLVDGLLRWDLASIYREIHNCIDRLPRVDLIGIDSWGVDFGLVSTGPQDADTLPINRIVEAPVCYREPSHEQGLAKVLSHFSREELYARSGNQVLAINSLAQIASRAAELNRRAEADSWALLPFPDLIAFCLTGELGAEESMLSTTMFYDPQEREIIADFLRAVDFHPERIAERRLAGQFLGRTHPALFGGRGIPVVTVLGHDTAGAFLLSEAFSNPQCAFLSCGTWSLLGAGLPQALRQPAAAELNLSHELSAFGSIYAVKNLTGLYWIERLRQSLGDQAPDFAELNVQLAGRKSGFHIDTEDSHLLQQDDLFSALQELAAEQGQSLDATDAHLLLYDSLVARYVSEIQALKLLCKREFTRLHVVGGGSKSEVFMQKIADATGLEVLAGPAEASALGNLVMQLYAFEQRAGDFSAGSTDSPPNWELLERCRERYRNLETVRVYKPGTVPDSIVSKK